MKNDGIIKEYIEQARTEAREMGFNSLQEAVQALRQKVANMGE